EQSVARLAAAEANIAKLETALAAQKNAAPDASLVARIAALETTLRSLGELPARVEALDAAQKKAVAAKSTDPRELAALTARVAALEQAATALDQGAAARPAQSGGADHAGRIAFVAVALRNAAERGDPFAQELAAAKALAPNAALAPLEPYAASGVP